MQVRRPKSYWLECLVYILISEGAIKIEGKSYAELAVALFDAVNNEFTPYFNSDGKVSPIADPMLKNNVAWNWERPAFETFMRRIRESLKLANRALYEEEEQAINLWQKVFGNDFFPSTLENSLAAFSKAALIGGLRTTSNGLIGINTEKTTSWSIPQHKFYGEDED